MTPQDDTVIRNDFNVVQWLRLHTANIGGLGLTPGQRTRSHVPQLSVRMLQ